MSSGAGEGDPVARQTLDLVALETASGQVLLDAVTEAPVALHQRYYHRKP